MLAPLPIGTPRDAGRFDSWLDRFTGYFDPVTRNLIEQWLTQFKKADRDLAARILDSVQFLGNGYIHTTFKQLLVSLGGWHTDEARRQGRWFFVPFSGSSGESADTMVHKFRMANGLSYKKFNNVFVYRRDLVTLRPGPQDTVVLIDDFSGSGNQACESWKEIFSELLGEGPRVLLVLVAATSTALDRIAGETEMQPICGLVLQPRENLHHTDCTYFTAEEKNRIREYCKVADGKHPDGFAGCGLLLVLAHRCPNNSLPILYSRHSKWRGLFPRHDR